MRYFSGDGSQDSETEFGVLKSVDSQSFAHVNSPVKMPVPMRKYPNQPVDLILDEYANVSTVDLDTSGVA